MGKYVKAEIAKADDGIFGNDNGGNSRYIAMRENTTPKELRIGYGSGYDDINVFPPKANPTTSFFFQCYRFTTTVCK